MHPRRGWRLPLACLGFAAAAAATAEPPDRLVTLGVERKIEDVAALDGSTGNLGLVRIVVPWDAIEPELGRLDWSAIEAAVDAVAATGSRVVLTLDPTRTIHPVPGGLPSPVGPASFDAWIALVRDATRRLGSRVLGIEIGGADAPGASPDAYAFLLKASALAIRAESRAQGPLVVEGAVAATDLATVRALWDRDVAAYVDVASIRVGPSGDPDSVARFLAETLTHPPAPTVWAYVARDERDPWASSAGALRALAAGAAAALLEAPPSSPEADTVLRWIAAAEGAIGPGFAPAPTGGVRFEGPSGEPRADAEALAAFVGPDGASTVLWILAPDGASPSDDRVVLDTSFAGNVRRLDAATGEELPIGSGPAGRGGRGRAVRIARGSAPSAILYERPTGTAGFDLGPQEVETTRTRELTAEEIVARYQQVQRFEDDRLERWIADARIDYHAKLAQGGGSIEVSIDARYFWERGGQLEWEETGYRINGNRVSWEQFPEIPLIQPEKVFTLPLDLTLDRTYRYRRLGNDTVAGREQYVLEFEPEAPEPGHSLYRGRVWIDAEDFHRTRVSLLQTGLEAPVLSNEEVDHYAARTDGAGTTFRLLERTNGQQNWSVGGRTVVVRREVTFSSYDVNPSAEEFQRRRDEAYRSDNKMVRDTPDGIRYLKRNPDGTRSVKPVDTSRWLAAAGAFRDASSSGTVPFLGANYFDFDLGHKDIQINALIGGVVNLLTASKPDIGAGTSATVEGFASVIHFSDQVFVGQVGLDSETVDVRPQGLDVRFGFPLRPYLRFNLGANLAFRQYDRNDDSNRALAAYNADHPGQSLRFVLPPNHRTLSGVAELEFNRKGWTVTADAAWNKRSEWAAFGPYDDTAGGFVVFDPTTTTYVPGGPEPVEDRFALYGATAFREWYLPAFQKLRIEGQWLDGSNLDRFSSYQFSLFGRDRLSGFAGTGVRFDRGWIARGGWSFNLFEAIRFDALVETAAVRERGSPDITSSFTGVGLAATVLGPWQTVWNLSYGRAVDSEIPELEGSDEFFFLLLKLF